ncbi:MAG TPA: ferritin-like domain-containing protein [Polyangiales bacterium]|nr:ferritin-like domain-containing protein [Polyangiales bacterium]
MDVVSEFVHGLGRFVSVGLTSRLGAHRAWPSRAVLLDEPLALAEERTSRLRRIYEKCADNLWDGPSVFREAVNKHGGIQLSLEQRQALAYPISAIVWGELAAWIVSAELAERLDDPDARMAASSQVFDEARHFYVMRDYLALLHVPVPPVDPFFAAGVRSLLDSRDLTLKLLAMQILVEGVAQSIFKFLADSRIEPVLSEILPYIERDEARHVGLGILHLPARLSQLSVAQRRSLARRVTGIGDLLGLAQVRTAHHWRTLGLEPRELVRSADGMLLQLARKLGTVPGTDRFYFKVDDPRAPDYHKKLDWLLPLPETPHSPQTRWVYAMLGLGARTLVL